jgi:SAM-dependent methyltransferase
VTGNPGDLPAVIIRYAEKYFPEYFHKPKTGYTAESFFRYRKAGQINIWRPDRIPASGDPMIPEHDAARSHYAKLLARNYVWMAGGMDTNIVDNIRFFSGQSLIPAGSGIAIDLGAGCGFQSVALASAGYRVIAVDFSQPMLDLLPQPAGTLPVTKVCADLLSFEAWAGHSPELIVCMGDTLTHLPDAAAARNLIRHCAAELAPGGKLILSLRDYSQDPEGTTKIIPVRRDSGRIFVCRLDYDRETVRVTDILYTHESGKWIRAAGTYPKLRLAPGITADLITTGGLVITGTLTTSGMTTILAEKSFHPAQ